MVLYKQFWILFLAHAYSSPTLKNESENEKKAPVKAVAKAEGTIKPRAHVPAKHVLTTFDQLMKRFSYQPVEDFRGNLARAM